MLVGMSCVYNEASNERVTEAAMTGVASPVAGASGAERAAPESRSADANAASSMSNSLPRKGADGMMIPQASANPRASGQSMAGSKDAGTTSQTTDAAPVSVCLDGERRCASAMLGTLETCVGGQWAPESCAADEMCLDAADGARCVLPVEACTGRDGENVCTDAGEMLACLPAGEAMTVATCADPALCKAGIASGRCAECVPGVHECRGQDLEACDPEGQGFVVQESCASAVLCDQQSGRCAAPSCEAEEHLCEGNALKRCNKDLTAFELVRQCGPGLCDEENRTCRMCMPGQARCSSGSRQQCDDQGRMFAAAACPEDTPICYGNGECAECATTRDCAPRACHVVSCGSQRCTYRPTPSTPRNCRYSDGAKIRPGGVDGPGLIYVIVAGAAFHIYTAEDLNANFGGLDGVSDTQGSGPPCGSQPIHGVNLRETDDNRIGHIGDDGRWHHIVNGADFTNNCGGSVLLIPAGGLARNGITIGDSI